MPMNKKTIGAILMLAFVIGVIAALGYEAETTRGDSNISGLNTSDTVRYQFFDSLKTVPLQGETTAGPDGKIVLPPVQWRSDKSKQTALNLDITRNGQKAAILIRYDAEKQEYKITGQGFNPFQPVELGFGDDKNHSKTDWAGMFRDTLAPQNKREKEGPIRLAFSGSVAEMQAQNNPLLIKIYQESGQLRSIDEEPEDKERRLRQILREIPQGPNEMPQILDDIQTEEQGRYIIANLIKPLMMMTEQLTAVMVQHVMTVGTFMDAKNQMETQRAFQDLQAEAHRDYHPSEQMCMIGTFSRSLNDADSSAEYNKLAYSKTLMDWLTLKKNSSGPSTIQMRERIRRYQENYCDPADHNNNLAPLCTELASEHERANRDINFTMAVLDPLTIDANFSRNEGAEAEKTEKDLIELGKNLYMFEPFLPIPDPEELTPAYANMRHLTAMQNVASTSLSAIIGAKSKTYQAGSNGKAGPYMKKLIEMMLPDTEDAPSADDILGKDPSYYAMMEVLTKKMYQEPAFYTNLYDKPANVERVKASLKAIQLMHNRDRYKSALRREMLSSLLLENALAPEQERINSHIDQIINAGGSTY